MEFLGLIIIGAIAWYFVGQQTKAEHKNPPSASAVRNPAGQPLPDRKEEAVPTGHATRPPHRPGSQPAQTRAARANPSTARGDLKPGSRSLPVISNLYSDVLADLLLDQANVFLTGKAGTGKSTLLRQFVSQCGPGVAIVAPTGIAAINVGGETIHRFFGLPIHYLEPGDIPLRRPATFWKALKTLVIDEVSMVRADLMRAMDISLRKNRQVDKPFGGVRVILVGDLGQLPPVVAEPELEQVLRDQLGGSYFHNYAGLYACDWKVVELRHVFRQEDRDFVGMLDAIREGSPPRSILDGLNRRKTADEPSEKAIILTLTNKRAAEINEARLQAILEPASRFAAVIEGEFPKESYPTDVELTLKAGAKVMMLRNSGDGKWVNGTIATVAKILGTSVWVRINGNEFEVATAVWEKFGYAYDAGTQKLERKVVGRFKQLPLRLAWAITIHKSQGLSLDIVHVDLPRSPWAHGQLYVGLSRCRSFQGLTLSREIGITDIVVDNAAFAFGRDIPLSTSSVAGIGLRAATQAQL